LKSDWRSQKDSTPRPNSLAPQGAHSPDYRIVRDGLTLLVMDLTGKKALAFKLMFRMEAAAQVHRTAAQDRTA
jgi:phage regulator Rha-like protein